MKHSYTKILNILKKVRRRVLLKLTLRNLAIGVCAALFTGIVISLMSRILPVYRVYTLCIYISIPIIILSLLSTFAMIPKKASMARLVDSFGLRERVTTALELEKENSPYKELLVQDTEAHLEKLNYKEKIRVAPNKKIIITITMLIVAFGATMLLPEPLKEKAEQAHVLDQYKKEQKKKAEKSEKEVKENKTLTEEQKKELLAKLAMLKQELKKAKDSKEADKALEKTAMKLEQLKKSAKSEDLKTLAEKLTENQYTKDLAKALRTENANEIKKQLEELKNKSKSMDQASKKSLQSALENASNSMEGGELKDSIEGLSNSISSGDKDAIVKSVDKVSSAINNSLSQEDMNEALAQAQSNLQDQQTGSTSAQGQGSGKGQGAGSGTGSGTGSGSGQGQGAGGSGAGSGSGNGDGGVTPYGQGGIANKPQSSGTEKQYEKVFTPSRLGGQGETSAVTGKSDSAGKSETSITSNSNATLGELKPYNQVVGEYSEKAMESVNNSSIPSGMEEIIKSYFASLQE